MPDDSDVSIERIVRLANEDVCEVIATKIGRSLAADELSAISTIIGTEYFWARAEELRMFVQHQSASHVLDTINMLRTRFRDGTLTSREDFRETTTRVLRCDMCNSSGACYCIRKEPGTAAGCPRCGGTGKCRHCNGTGTR